MFEPNQGSKQNSSCFVPPPAKSRPKSFPKPSKPLAVPLDLERNALLSACMRPSRVAVLVVLARWRTALPCSRSCLYAFCCQVLGCGMWPFWHRMHGISQQGCKGELVLAGAATEGREHACVFCSGQTRMDLPEDSVPLPSGAGISHERARGQASLVGCGVAHILCSVQSSSRRRALVGVSGQHSRVKICHLTDRKLQTLACADKSGLATRSEMWSLRQPRGCRSLVTGRVVLREL